VSDRDRHPALRFTVATPDRAPEVARDGEIEVSYEGEAQIPFTASDDYAVAQGIARIELALDEVDRRYGLRIEPESREVIELPLPVARPILQWDEQMDQPPVTVHVERRAVMVQLWDPAFDVVLPVVDIEQNVYLLHIRPEAEGDLVESGMLVRFGEDLERERRQREGRGVRDTDGATTHLATVMATGIDDPTVSVSRVSRYERSQRVPGRVLFADDDYSITLYAIYQSSHLMGYETVHSWSGDEPYTFDLRAWSFPGHRGTCVPTTDLRPRTTPYVTLQPGGATKVYYIGTIE